MKLLAPARRFDPDVPELIDRPDTDHRLLREELHVLEKLNRHFGAQHLVVQYVRQFVDWSGVKSLNLLDLATGMADIPRAIVTSCRQSQLPVTITAVDRNPEILQIAREYCQGWPEIRLEQHDLLGLPFAAGSFDLVLCSLALHHFDSAAAVAVLRRAQEIARLGYIVCDLRRNWLAIWIMELFTRTLIRSHIASHDARQSCRAAFTTSELGRMAQQASLSHFQIKRHHGVFRMVLEGRKRGKDEG